MRVVVVGPLPPPLHGAARVTAASCALLRNAGVAVSVFDSGVSGGGPVYHLRRLGVHIRAAARIGFGPRLSAVYVGGAGGLGLWYQAMVVAVARVRGVPIVFHHHSSQYLRRRAVAMVLLARTGGPRMTHVTLSEGMTERLRHSYAAVTDTISLSNSAFISGPAVLPTRPDGRPGLVVLGHLSNLSRPKGLLEVLETFETLRGRGLDVVLRLAGPALAEDDRSLIDAFASRHPGRLDFVGPLTYDQVEPFLTTLDLFLFPSRYRHEAEPLVVLEAAAVGVPTVAYAVGSIAEVVGAVGGWPVPVDGSFSDTVDEVVRGLQRAGSTCTREKVHSGLKQFQATNAPALGRLIAKLTERAS